MPYAKTILCLANSRKPPSGRCIAGREIGPGSKPGAWIRPVSARATHEISEEERRYQDGTDPCVLDIIEIQFSSPSPSGHQHENHLIDDQYYWERKGAVTWSNIGPWVESVPGPLWLNGSSSYNGINDQVPLANLSSITKSLYLVTPSNLQICVAVEGLQPRRRVRATFDLAGAQYSLAVTDPAVERPYLAGPDGSYPLAQAALCVSLGEAFNGFAYKLVASVITP